MFDFPWQNQPSKKVAQIAGQHELRANHQTNRMNAAMGILKAHHNEMFRQFEQARMLTIFSSVSIFEYLGESVVGGGYVRFQKV